METSSSVQPISCDEAFMDITGLGDPDQLVRQLRDKIVAATGINASAGIGPNMLLARLATKRAKPNGQFNINPSQVCQPPTQYLNVRCQAVGLPMNRSVHTGELCNEMLLMLSV